MPDVMSEFHHAKEHVVAGQVVLPVGGEVPLGARTHLAGLQAILRREHVLSSIHHLIEQTIIYSQTDNVDLLFLHFTLHCNFIIIEGTRKIIK